MTKFAALLILASIALAVSTSAKSAAPVLATEAQNGKTVAIAKGASLVISLQSNPSTGYSWQVGKNDNAILKLVGKPEFQPPAHQMPGTPGRQLFTFEAIAPGHDAVELGYFRPWEKDVAPAKTFSIVVSVE